MPPKIKSLTQKRKAVESDTSPKRVKRDPGGLDRCLQTLSSPNNRIIKLSGALPKVPDDEYVNPTAKDLFLQVEVYNKPS